jgi:hypothetical protein
MKGGICSDEGRPMCGGVFIDNHINALICPKHSKYRAGLHKVKFGGLAKRFQAYDAASRFLTGVRFKSDEATFDERDYKKDNPLGFSNIADKWLSYHAGNVRAGT